MSLRVGTRGSKLSLVQTDLVVARLLQEYPDLEIQTVVISTAGDRDRETPLLSLNQKGIFEKEIDEAVVAGRVDFAVHSLKDLPTFESGSQIVIGGVLERGSTADVLVSQEGETLKEMEPGSVVGTSSPLRVAQLKRVRPDLEARPIRGNVETRVGKVDGANYDAVILAEAGLTRLGMADRISERLSLEDFIPAPCQGTIAAVARQDNGRMIGILQVIEDSATRAEAEAERELVRVLEGGCKVPVGAVASCISDTIMLTAYVLSLDGGQRLEAKRTGEVKNAVDVARKAGNDLLIQGAKGLEQGWRELIR